MSAGFRFRPQMTSWRWSGICPTVLRANISGWAFASSTAGGSSGHPGVTRFRYTQRYLGPMTHSVEGNPRLSLRGSDCDDSQVVGALT
jgi:hypothetical protein